jgi:hypothetical protein
MLTNPNNLDISKLPQEMLVYLNKYNIKIKTVDDNLNINCKGCINCIGCIDCIGCKGCIGSRYCKGCIGCIGCESCKGCIGCINCEGESRC